MNTNNSTIHNFPTDKVIFPGSQLSPDDERIDTTFFFDFKLAEMSGFAAVKDTFKRAFENWKHNIKYLTELTVVTNQLCWMHNGKNQELSKFYAECYYKCTAYANQADEDGNNVGPFTDEELQFFFAVLD